MALPSIIQDSQNINGVTVQCAKFIITEPANFRLTGVLDKFLNVNDSQTFTFQSIMRASGNLPVVISFADKQATFNLNSAWEKYITKYEGINPQNGTDGNIYFQEPGEYWFFHTMLEHGNMVSDWRVSPDDTEDQLRNLYTEITENYTNFVQTREAIIMDAVSNYTLISDFETYKTENAAALEITAQGIESRVSETYETKTDAETQYRAFESSISQNAHDITLKVSSDDYNAVTIAAMINAKGSTAIIEADHIQLSGDVVLKSNLTDGETQISGDNIATGTISADRIKGHSLPAEKLSGKIETNDWALDFTTGTFSIGTISANRLTAGEINGNTITVTNINASNITSGTLDPVRIPDLDAGKIKTGTLDASQVTVSNISADNINGGVLKAQYIDSENLHVKAANVDGTLSASQINVGQINIDTAQVTTGVFQTARIPDLSATKITSGYLSADRIEAGSLSLDKLTVGARQGIVASTYTERQYYLSDSSSAASGSGKWSTTVPIWTSGKYIWTREATTTSYADGTTSTTYSPDVGGTYDKALTTALSTASGAQTSANGAVKRSQQIYISRTNTSAPSRPSSWVSGTGGSQNAWTTKRPQYNSTYPILFVATQREFVNGTFECTTPLIDETTTVIDGGHITTGTISANRIEAHSLDISKIGGNIKNGTWEIDFDEGTMTIGKLSAGSITAGTITAAVTATKLTMTGGSIQIDSAIDGTNYIYLEGTVSKSRMQPGAFIAESDANYVLLDHSGLLMRPQGGTRKVSITPGGTGKFVKLESSSADISDTLSVGILRVNGTTVTGASDTYAKKLSVLFGDSEYKEGNVRLPNSTGNATYVGSKTLAQYVDGRIPSVATSRSDTSSGKPSGISDWHIKYSRYGNLVTVVFWFTASAALSSSNGNGTPGLPTPRSIGSTSYKQQWYGAVGSSDGKVGYAYIGASGSLNCRTKEAGTFYGCITYEVA